MADEKVSAVVIPICMNGAIIVEEGKFSPEKLGEVFNEVMKDDKVLKEIDSLLVKINEVFAKKSGVDKFIITLIPAIYPIKDKEYAELVKQFIDELYLEGKNQ